MKKLIVLLFLVSMLVVSGVNAYAVTAYNIGHEFSASEVCKYIMGTESRGQIAIIRAMLSIEEQGIKQAKIVYVMNTLAKSPLIADENLNTFVKVLVPGLTVDEQNVILKELSSKVAALWSAAMLSDSLEREKKMKNGQANKVNVDIDNSRAIDFKISSVVLDNANNEIVITYDKYDDFQDNRKGLTIVFYDQKEFPRKKLSKVWKGIGTRENGADLVAILNAYSGCESGQVAYILYNTASGADGFAWAKIAGSD